MDTCVGLVESQDIAGIGVRVAFYLQSFLTVCASSFPNADIKGSFWTMTVTTLSLIVSAGTETSKGQLSLYNAILVTYLAFLHVAAATYIVVPRSAALPPSELFNADLSSEEIEQAAAVYTYNQRKVSMEFAFSSLFLAASLQNIATCVFAIYIWLHAASYGNQVECNADTIILIVGKAFSAVGKGRTIALALLYTITSLVGGTNLIMLIFGIFSKWMIQTSSPQRLLPRADSKRHTWTVVLFMINWLYIMITVEISIKRNPVIHEPVRWSFGQIFALVSVLTPLLSLYYAMKGYYRPKQRNGYGDHREGGQAEVAEEGIQLIREDGYRHGLQEGFQRGRDEGYQQGWAAGLQRGQEA